MIEVKNLTRKFNGFTALQNINFSIVEGEVLAYLGPNGAGKSTTVNILVTLLTPTSGKVFIDGYDVTKEGMTVRRLIGYLPEDLGLYPGLTVYENLDFVGGLYRLKKSQRKERKEKIKELLEFFNLEEKQKAPVSTLSKGTKQKVSLAKALIHDPKILILDEPTSGLDPSMAKEVLNLIRELKKENKTILMTTHILARAEKVCDSVALISGGRISGVGKIAEIKSKLKTSSLEEVYFAVVGESHG
ncbi:MAG: ABC transporter ATP-binding protein [Candidatus Hodarchaeales archaeon]|jgi:ABC-2 type transport system ATP-binding protein